jgi:hypothetical protein
LSKIFRDYDQKALDDQYEQRVWVPHADEIIRRYAAASDEVRAIAHLLPFAAGSTSFGRAGAALRPFSL